MSHRLHRVRVEEYFSLPAYFSYLSDRLKRPDLIIGIHHRDKTGVLPYRCLQLLCAYYSVGMNRQIGHTETFPFQLFERVKHRVMLYLVGNNVGLAVFLS